MPTHNAVRQTAAAAVESWDPGEGVQTRAQVVRLAGIGARECRERKRRARR